MLTLWHTFMLLGLSFFPCFFFLLGGFHCFFLKNFLFSQYIEVFKLKF
jgi:hypothetical protein